MARSNYAGFTSIELSKPARSMFDLSHEKRMSCRMGWLVPFFITETLPNDTFQVTSEMMLRLAPLVAPIMHRVNVTAHFFFVPNRLLWEDWEEFITGGNEGPGIDTAPIPPNYLLDDVLVSGASWLDQGSLSDYLGLNPIPDAQRPNWLGRKIDVLGHAACYKAWYDYYRDRNYQLDDQYDILPLPSGQLDPAVPIGRIDRLFEMKQANWQKEMFTSALPWTQRGSQVLIPMEADVNYLEKTRLFKEGTNTKATAGSWSISTDVDGSYPTDSQPEQLRIENIESIENSTVTINDFRRALALQSWMERSAIGGSRLNETIYAHFARRTSDGRLQMAEYLGGARNTVKISEVVTTAFSSDDGGGIVPPANMAGHGLALGSTNRFRYNCEEWGFIVGFLSIAPTPAYMQGAPRFMFGRNTFLDYAWPAFATLGEQPVYTYELYADPTTLPVDRTEQEVFGYQSRYIDWKYIQSSSHGDFRSTLDYWHLTRKFATKPGLNVDFGVVEDDLQDRVFAVSNVDTIWIYLYNNVRAVRSLPYFGTPKLRG